MILAHSFVGYPLVSLWVRNQKYTKLELDFLYFVGVVSAVLPDFDLSLMLIYPDANHRTFITHSLVPYISLYFLGLLIYFLYFKKHRILTTALNIFLAAVLSHLFLDFFVGGLSILAPLDPKLYGYDIYTSDNGFWSSYFTSFYMIWELLIIIPFIWVINKTKTYPLNKYGLSLSILFFLFSTLIPLIFALK